MVGVLLQKVRSQGVLLPPPHHTVLCALSAHTETCSSKPGSLSQPCISNHTSVGCGGLMRQNEQIQFFCLTKSLSRRKTVVLWRFYSETFLVSQAVSGILLFLRNVMITAAWAPLFSEPHSWGLNDATTTEGHGYGSPSFPLLSVIIAFRCYRCEIPWQAGCS